MHKNNEEKLDSDSWFFLYSSRLQPTILQRNAQHSKLPTIDSKKIVRTELEKNKNLLKSSLLWSMLFEICRKRVKKNSGITLEEKPHKEKKETEEMQTRSTGSTLALLAPRSTALKGHCTNTWNSSIHTCTRQIKETSSDRHKTAPKTKTQAEARNSQLLNNSLTHPMILKIYYWHRILI